MYFVRRVYVFYVFVCIDYEHEDCFLESIIPKDM